MKLRSLLAATAFAAAAMLGSNASATTYGTIGGVNGGNEYLGVNTLNGYFGGNLYLVGGPADIQVTILGHEAGYNNSFTFGTPSCPGVASCSYSTAGDPDTFPVGGVTSWTVLGVASGLLDFVFGVNGGAGSVENGWNPENTPTNPNFFVSFLPDENSTFGLSVLLFLDDGAGDGTDNHDDLIVRLDVLRGGYIAPVPLPAGGLLLIGALGGLALIRRRKSA
jgi:hypothetical protein